MDQLWTLQYQVLQAQLLFHLEIRFGTDLTIVYFEQTRSCSQPFSLPYKQAR